MKRISKAKFEVKLAVDSLEIESLIVSAFEGGSNYWYRIEDGGTSRNYLHDVLKGKGLVVSDFHAKEQGKPLRKKLLDAKAVKLGLQKMANSKEYAHHFADVLSGNADGATGDVFLQFCLFGKVIYG